MQGGKRETKGERLCDLQGNGKLNLWYWIIINKWEHLETNELYLWKRWLPSSLPVEQKVKGSILSLLPNSSCGLRGNSISIIWKLGKNAESQCWWGHWWEYAFTRVPGCYLEMLEYERHYQNVQHKVWRKNTPSSSTDKPAWSLGVFVYPIIILTDIIERKWVKVTATLDVRCEPYADIWHPFWTGVIRNIAMCLWYDQYTYQGKAHFHLQHLSFHVRLGAP